MANEIDIQKDLEIIIKNQRGTAPSSDLISETLKNLHRDDVVEYVRFLEENHRIGLNSHDGTIVLLKLGIADKEFIGKYANQLKAGDLAKLEKLVNARPDNLCDIYLSMILPEPMINDFALLEAEKFNRDFEGKFKNNSILIHLAVKLNSAPNVDHLFDMFLEMEKKYYDENYPAVDIHTFFKLVKPVLKRISVKKGMDVFYAVREKIVAELKKHGVTPDQLAIEILDRRNKHRSRPPIQEDYDGFDFC